MKKLLILLFGTLIGLPALSQVWLVEGYRIWKPYYVTPKDGMTIKTIIHGKMDSVLFSQTGLDTFEMTITYRKITKDKPPVVLPDLITTIDDNVITEAQKYNPVTNGGDNIYMGTTAWSHMKAQPWNQTPDGTPIHYNKTYSMVDLAGSYVELTCTCYKVEWWSELRENHGIVEVKMDDVRQDCDPKVDGIQDCDLYRARTDNNSLLVWTSPPGLSNGTHVFRINYTGRKNAAATATNIGHDKFVTYTKQ